METRDPILIAWWLKLGLPVQVNSHSLRGWNSVVDPDWIDELYKTGKLPAKTSKSARYRIKPDGNT